jgi:hypothetical protein
MTTGDRGRALEGDYFRGKDRELIAKLHDEKARRDAREQLGVSSGLEDAALLDELEALGFIAETAALLPLVPLVQVAWAEDTVSDAERALLLKFARARGIAEGTVADCHLSDWLVNRPSADVFDRATRLLGSLLHTAEAEPPSRSIDELVAYCEDIAAASGGVFGFHRISAAERKLLAEVAARLTAPDSTLK